MRKFKGLDFGNKVIILSISLFTVLGLLTITIAGGISLERAISIDNVENLTVNIPNGTTDLGDGLMLGSGSYVEDQNDIVTSTTPYSTQLGINLWDGLRWGDDPNIDSYCMKEKFLWKDFTDATNTIFAIQIQEGDGATKRIYLDEIDLQLTGMSTTSGALQVFVGTSTDANTSDDYSDLIAETDPNEFGLMNGITVSHESTSYGTSTVFNSDNYPRTASGVYATTTVSDIPLYAGTYIVGFASTSGEQDKGTGFFSGDQFAGRVFIKYRTYCE